MRAYFIQLQRSHFIFTYNINMQESRSQKISQQQETQLDSQTQAVLTNQMTQNQVGSQAQSSDKDEAAFSDEEEDNKYLQNEQQQEVPKPTPQPITEDECFDDDSAQSSKDGVVEEQEELIGDSDEEQAKKIKEQDENQQEPVTQEHNYAKMKGKLRLRDYQNILFNRSLDSNRIIYLPTGKGKTLVAIASMYYYLCKEGQDKKIIFLANTIQLVKQQADSIKRNLQSIMDDDELSNSLKEKGRPRVRWNSDMIKQKVCCIHGQKTDQIGMTRRKKIEAQLTNKKKITEMLQKSTIIVMISQMFLNCLRRGYIRITDFSFMVFDECHHCHGNHPYAGIMRQFYFDPPKPDQKAEREKRLYQKQLRLPIIMGLTASPVMQETFDKNKIVKQIDELCGNLNSRFTAYTADNKKKNETSIQLVATKQLSHRQAVPDLIAHFEKYRDHRQSYNKIQKHFPQYFQCVKKVIDFLKSKYEKSLDLETDPNTIGDIQLLLFYDIKQCFLIKLRDVWLELGQYAFSIAFQELYVELGKINLKNQENKLILHQVMEIIKDYIIKFKQLYGSCQPKHFSAKVKQLVHLLSIKNDSSSQQMVVIFASKRRTVKYLDRIIKDYKETLSSQQEKAMFDCDKVTGYSIRTKSDYSINELIFEADPSSFRFQAQVQMKYNAYIRELAEEKNQKYSKFENQQSQSKNLANQLRRMSVVKYGKLLLQVEQKYSTQIETIKRFRAKKFKILITTSVTEEGFDIPECKIVISFDKPSSLKSYIQIKGRARQQLSKYYIFTTERDFKQMKENKEIYDDIINATFEIAINKFSDIVPSNNQNSQKIAVIRQEQGYRKITVRQTGAVLNTSYALQILKMYCSSLRHPNKLRFYFVQTPNVSFRCLIHFPTTAPTSKPFITGQAQTSKHAALKSAAFEAVKYLYKEKYIKGDLRPKKYEELEDEREIQKFEDFEYARKNQQYRQILESQVRIKSETVTDRKFIRFYFRTLKSVQLDFPKINPHFSRHVDKFETQRFPFQIYMMNFSNTRNVFKNSSNHHEIGVLTCFQMKYVEEVFSGYEYSFQQNSNQKFTLKLAYQKLLLNNQQYQKLKKIHQFLINSALGREVYHYCQITQKRPIKERWERQKEKADLICPNSDRKYFPILILLKKESNGNYTIDQKSNKKIIEHEELFKNLYQFHNVGGKQKVFNRFPISLINHYENLNSQLSSWADQELLVQSIQKQHCFSKCIISGIQAYNPEAQKIKDNKKLTILSTMFDHVSKEVKEVIRIVFWNKLKKQKMKELFERDGKQTIKMVENSRYYFPFEFVLFPISASLLFKAGIACQFLFKAVFQYSLAFEFRNIKLPNIFKQKMKDRKLADIEPILFQAYPNVILQNGLAIFKYLQQNSRSQYLKNIGKSFKLGTKFEKPVYQCSFSKMNIDQSMIQNKNSMVADSMNMSELGLSNILDGSAANNSHINHQKSFAQSLEEQSLVLISQIKVTQILKVLTSRMYKFNKQDNYEQYEFIGDVVLKMLSTVQIFLEKPKSDESQLHISRANIICNVNLHRKAILNNVYRYILSKKIEQLPPPYSYTISNTIPQQFYEKTQYKAYNENTELQGFHFIPGKVHADIVEGLIGAFYLHARELNDCQILLYFLDILKQPFLKVNYNTNKILKQPNALPKLYEQFENRIDYRFKNKGLLIQAFTHSSFKSILNTVIDKNDIKQIFDHVNKDLSMQSSFMSMDTQKYNKKLTTKVVPWETFYERLQFLGDSILDLIVVEYLHDTFGTQDQGSLTALKQAGVSNKTLGMIAISYGMHQLILMDYSQNDKVMSQFKKILANFNHYLNNPQALMEAKIDSIKILGDIFQALVGAIFVDLQLDYTLTKAVVMRLIKEFLVHYTNMEMTKKTINSKYQQYMKSNNYRDCQLKKDTTVPIENGNFKFLLKDRSGAIIDQCWETTEKRAWDVILQKFYSKKTNQQTKKEENAKGE